jgi:hypothetical protein
VFVASASPGGSATFEADYKFPTDEDKIQVYENGVEIAQSRFSVSGKEITITSPIANAYYQVRLQQVLLFNTILDKEMMKACSMLVPVLVAIF